MSSLIQPQDPAPDLADPRWFLDTLDLETIQARFVRVDRQDLSREAFLDPRWDRSRLPYAALPGSALDAASANRIPVHFIWHTSFCCSTLIAALLDLPGKCLALKEPRGIVDLADLKRRQQGLKRPGLARAVFGLYGRRFQAAEQVLIKPSNFANNLMAEAQEMTSGRMLMLHTSCRSFLTSILKAGEARRGYVRQLFISLAADGHPQAKLPLTTLLGLSDLHVAALAWHMQMAAMQAAMASSSDRSASLDGDLFLDRPREGLAALNAFFGLGLAPGELYARSSEQQLSRDAKTGDQGAGRERRRSEALEVEQRLGGHLDHLIEWAAQASPDSNAPLPRALL